MSALAISNVYLIKLKNVIHFSCYYINLFSRKKMIIIERFDIVKLFVLAPTITRNGSVHIDYRRTAVGQKAVSVSGAKLWNSIPMNIINSNTIVTFKSHMYQHLLEHQ